jgi:hypothetical protein
MKSAYLVTENVINAEILKRVLPPEVVQMTEIVVARGAYAARSLAGTILSERMRPVALVVDASTDSARGDEQEQTIKSLLLPAASGIPYEVCVATPNLGESLIQSWRDSTQLSSIPASLTEELDQASAEQLQSIGQHPLICRLLQFLDTSVQQAA